MVELLAPAGTPDALRAAIAAGADAVYVGLGAFNARAANAGFTMDELASGCRLAHARGARVYVALNVYVRDSELDDAVALASVALGVGADALIVADMGLISRIRAALPEAELHLSTQAGVQSAEAALFAARELGVERVTCARELSVAELAALARTGVEIEAFCHGAICICYSGACSYSALLRGRSANRGDCTQPCRLAYELRDDSGAVLAGGAWTRGCAPEGPAARPEGDRLLCPRDYLGIRHIADMLGAGVSAFKIEGRMKSPDYVYNTVGCYRAALDAALSGRPLDDAGLAELEARLAGSFSRGFTSGYLEGGHAATGAALMSVERAINQGLSVGRVTRACREGAIVSFDRAVARGDMLEIRSTPGADAPADVPKRWPIVPCPRDIAAGEEGLIACKRKVEPGSAVHAVRSMGIIAEAEGAVRAMREEEDALAAASRSRGSEGVPTEAGSAISTGVDGAGVAERRFAHSRRGRGVAAGGRMGLAGAEGFGVDARGKGCAEAVDVPAVDAPSGTIDLGEVCRSEDVGDVRAACAHVSRGEAAAVLVRNVGQIPLVRDARVPWEAAPPLQVWNAETARILVRLGARRVWLPEELAHADLEAVRSRFDMRADELREVPFAACGGVRGAVDTAPDIIDMVPAGSTPLMIMEHCLLTAEGPCSNRCASCPRRLASQAGERFLVELDRKSSGARLAVRVDGRGRTRLYRA